MLNLGRRARAKQGARRPTGGRAGDPSFSCAPAGVPAAPAAPACALPSSHSFAEKAGAAATAGSGAGLTRHGSTGSMQSLQSLRSVESGTFSAAAAAGSVFLTLRVHPASGELEVSIARGHGVACRKAYVKLHRTVGGIEVPGTKRKSRVCPKPRRGPHVWNYCCTYDVAEWLAAVRRADAADECGSGLEVHSHRIQVSLWESSGVAANKCVGGFSVPLSDVNDARGAIVSGCGRSTAPCPASAYRRCLSPQMVSDSVRGGWPPWVRA